MAATPCDDKSVTKLWLENILEGYHRTAGEFPKLQVGEFKITPGCREGDGYMSELLALDVCYRADDNEQRVRLMAKLLPHDDFNRALVTDGGYDRREIMVYTETLPALTKFEAEQLGDKSERLPVPECFHALHREEGESILVLQDLRAQGFTLQDLNKGLSETQTLTALKSVAAVHATSVAMERKGQISIREQFPFLIRPEQAAEAFHSILARGLHHFLDFLKDKPEQAQVLNRMKKYSGASGDDVLQKLLQPSSKLNAIIHGDFWNNNIFFKGADQCRIIDWQLSGYGRPANDIAMFLSTSITSQMRRDRTDFLLQEYWAAFTQKLLLFSIKEKSLGYTFDDFKEDYRNGLSLAGLLVTASVDVALGQAEREQRVLMLISDLVEDGIL